MSERMLQRASGRLLALGARRAARAFTRHQGRTALLPERRAWRPQALRWRRPNTPQVRGAGRFRSANLATFAPNHFHVHVHPRIVTEIAGVRTPAMFLHARTSRVSAIRRPGPERELVAADARRSTHEAEGLRAITAPVLQQRLPIRVATVARPGESGAVAARYKTTLAGDVQTSLRQRTRAASFLMRHTALLPRPDPLSVPSSLARRGVLSIAMAPAPRGRILSARPAQQTIALRNRRADLAAGAKLTSNRGLPPASGSHGPDLVWRSPTANAPTAFDVAASQQSKRALDAPATTIDPARAAATIADAPRIEQNALRATALDPAIADRLADDVIRRVERRMRIERERRGI